MRFCKLVFWACPGGHPPHSGPPPSTIGTCWLLARGWTNRVLDPFCGGFGAQTRERPNDDRPVFRRKLEEITLKPKI